MTDTPPSQWAEGYAAGLRCAADRVDIVNYRERIKKGDLQRLSAELRELAEAYSPKGAVLTGPERGAR